MSIFGSILGKIFSHANAAPAPAPTGGTTAAPSPSSFNNPTAAPASPGTTSPAAAPAAPSAPATPGASAAPKPTQPVDVSAILDGLAAKNPQKLDWKHSIVDMMKLLDLDSSLGAREELAKELHYSGSTSDSATMNMWLHKQVMQKLADNGGKVPDDLR